MNITVFHRGLILVGLPLLLEIVLISCLSFLLYQSAEERLQESKYRKFSSEIAHLIGLVSSAPFVMAASVQFKNEKLYKQYEKEVQEIHDSMASLETVLKQIPEISSRDYKELNDCIDAVLAVTESISAKRHKISDINTIEKMENFQNTLVKSKQAAYLHLETMFTASDKMTKSAQKKLDRTQRNQMLILNIGLILNGAVALFLSWFFRTGILNRIRVIATNTERLARSESLLPEIGGKDEIAQFDRAFHSMLEQLQNAAKNEKELFKNASDVICVLDAADNFVKVNPASLKDWGMPPDELLGRNLKELMSQSDFELASTAIARSKETGNAGTFETQIETKGKGILLGLWSVYWSSDEQRLFCIIHDQTESKQIESSRKRFLTMISSDLKIPLSSISSSFNKLCDELLDKASEQAKDKLAMTRKNIRRLLSLVNDLLAVAQMDSGKFDLNPSQLKSKDLLLHAAADLESLADNKGISIEVICEDTAASVFADADRVIQVLVNLLSNAIKFSPNKSKIVLSCEPDKNNPQLALFKVSDSGRGIPDSHKESVFEKFSQVELADGQRKAGTGLGLPICKQIIEKHSGKIGVESAEGVGSTFWFTLPISEAAKQAQENTSPDPEPGAVPDCPGRDAMPLPVSGVPAPDSDKGSLDPNYGSGKFNLLRLLDNLSLGQKGSILVAIPVIAGLTLVLFLSNSLSKMEEERAHELHMREMAQTASEVSKYILYSSGSVVNSAENFRWNRFSDSLHAIKKLESALEGLTEDDPIAKKEFERFVYFSNKLEKYSQSLVKQKLENSQAGVASLLQEKIKQLPALVGSSRNLKNLIEHAEHFEFTSPEKEISLRKMQFLFLYFALLLNIGFSVLLAILFSVGVSKRILVMADNAARLANDDALNPIMSGKDELATLDKAFHRTAALLKEARKKERAVFDNCQDVLCIMTPTGQFLGINTAVESSWGYSKKEFLKTSVEAVVDSEDLASFKTALIAAPFKSHSLECQIKKADGSIIHTLWSASNQANQENIFCVVRDISAKKELEQLRKEFLAMVSHDLRTPLTAINGIVQLIQAGVFGPVAKNTNSYINTIRKNVGSLLDLISDILDLEKLSAGKMELNKAFVQVGELLKATKDQFSNLNCNLAVELEELKPDDSIKLDKDRLTNALSNLGKFLYLQSDRKTKLLLRVKQNGSTIEFQILDTGPVLPEKHRHEMFMQEREPWENESRQDDTQDDVFHADLLLPLAKKTIESHGGSICVETVSSSRNLIRVSIATEILSPEKI